MQKLRFTFQSTHPRGVRRRVGQDYERFTKVSIHAPTRGATSLTSYYYAMLLVSIHAPTRGATSSTDCLLPLSYGFNPRTHEGCDTNIVKFGQRKVCFNPRTHEGCDTSYQDYLSDRKSFNPRTHEGCDFTTPLSSSIRLFQSTHPRGVRLFVLANSLTPQGFNPRTHEGCDQRREVTISRFLRFNPRTHEGCDCKNTQCKQTQQVSIHAPTRGATSVADEIATAKDVSIHAPTRGATR